MEYTITTKTYAICHPKRLLHTFRATVDNGDFVQVDFLSLNGVAQEEPCLDYPVDGNGLGLDEEDYNFLERELLELAAEL